MKATFCREENTEDLRSPRYPRFIDIADIAAYMACCNQSLSGDGFHDECDLTGIIFWEAIKKFTHWLMAARRAIEPPAALMVSCLVGHALLQWLQIHRYMLCLRSSQPILAYDVTIRFGK